MDVVIPSHAVKTFCSSLSSLSKMGPDVYWDFEVLNGLTLRTINDAKTSYGCWHYEAQFFERCTVPTTLQNRHRHHNNKKRRRSEEERFTGRLASRSLQPLLRSRKAASLRITTASSHKQNDDEEEEDEDTMIIFTFSIEYSSDVMTSIQYDIPLTTQTETLCSVPDMTDASSLVAAPMVLWRLLEALSSSTAYVALIVRNNSSVAASSFTTVDSTTMTDGDGDADTNNNAAGAASVLPGRNNGRGNYRQGRILKSEAACDIEDLLDFDFVNNRDTLLGNTSGDDDDDRNRHQESMPENVNQEVILVFHVPEAKAFLQFATTVASQHAIHVSFHWGGKPALLEAKADTYSARVVLATLDHATLTAQRTMMEQASQGRSGGQ